MRTVRNCAIVILLAVTVAVAQKNHNQYEPGNGAGAGQVLLAKFVGHWNVVDTFYVRRGKPIVTKGVCVQRMIKDGKFLESDFTFFNADGSKKFTGTGISGFDPSSGRFTTVWIDSRRTQMSIRQSHGKFDGKHIVLWATSLDREHPHRTTFARAHLEDNGRVLIYNHYFLTPSGKPRKMFEMYMTRQ
ncbi:MAG: DUF1579 family protein [Terriglobales bacterium]